MKFKSDIEVQAGLRDGSDDIGTAGQLLSSTGTITNWIDQAEVVAAGATRVLIACKNTSGGTLTKGTPVYQTGNVGATDVIEVAAADALISTGYLPAIGLLETDLINNALGHVVITGELLNITTDPIDGLTPTTGDTIYLKSGGGLTLTKPTGEGNAIQNLGLVGKVSGGNAGSLTVASIMRQNDVPNLPTGKIWVGDGNTIVSDVVYLDEVNERMGINTTSPTASIHVVDNTTDDSVLITSTNTSSSAAPVITLKRDSSSPADGDYLGQLKFKGENSASQEIVYAKITGKISDVTDTTEDGLIETAVKSGGSNLIVSRQTGTDLKLINGIGLQVDGNVGIGTTSPGSKLDVSGGDIRLSTNATYLRLKDSAAAFPRVLGLNASNTFYIGPIDSYAGGAIAYGVSGNVSYHGFYGGGSEKVRITSSGNVGIGTTSPSHKLTINASNNTTALGIDFPSAHFDFAADSTSGYNTLFKMDNTGLDIGHESIFRSLNLKTGNLDRLTILGDGNVGIGTTSPSYKLDVSGGAYIDETLNIETTISGTLTYGYSGVGAGNLVVGGLNLASFTPGVITLMNQDTTISAGQDLGVLQFGGKDDTTNGYANGQIICTTAANAGTGNSGGGIFRFLLSGSTTGSGPSEKMRITNTGNVGIGTTSPSTKLHVVGNSEITGDIFLGRYIFHDNDTNTWIGFPSNDTISFRTNGLDRVRVTSSGNVGIGAASPAKKLTIGGIGIGNTDGLKIEDPSNTAYGAHFSFDDGSTTVEIGGVTNNTLNDCISIARDATRTITIDTSERVGIGTTTPSYKLDVTGEGRFTGDLRCLSLIQTSERDHKKDIRLVGKENSTIPIKEYKYKTGDNDKVRYGVVAEDIESTYPELVETDAEGIKGVKYIDLLVRKIAELETEKRTLVNWRHYHSNTSYNTLYDTGMTTAFPYAYGSIPAPYDMYFTSVTLVNNPYSSYSKGPLGDTATFQAYVNGVLAYEVKDIRYGQNPYESITADFGQNVRIRRGESLQIRFQANGTWRYCNSTIILTEI
jgi:hypothetical protein